MTIRWDYKSEAAASFDLEYQVGGSGNWIQIENNYPITADWNYWYSFSYDLSSISAIENQSVVEFSMNDLDRDPGNDRYAFDNLELTGIPEPATIMLFISGGLITIQRRRKR